MIFFINNLKIFFLLNYFFLKNNEYKIPRLNPNIANPTITNLPLFFGSNLGSDLTWISQGFM